MDDDLLFRRRIHSELLWVAGVVRFHGASSVRAWRRFQGAEFEVGSRVQGKGFSLLASQRPKKGNRFPAKFDCL